MTTAIILFIEERGSYEFFNLGKSRHYQIQSWVVGSDKVAEAQGMASQGG